MLVAAESILSATVPFFLVEKSHTRQKLAKGFL